MILRKALLLIALVAGALATGERCRASAGQQSCGQCIRQDIDCAWCRQSEYEGAYRCDTVSNLTTGGCDNANIYNPTGTVDRAGDRTVGELKSDGHTEFRLQPQRVQITMRMGETKSFDVTYLHRGDTAGTIMMLSSETQSRGLRITYEVDCHDTKEQSERCDNVADGDRVVFTVTLTLEECKAEGDIIVSVGVGGHRDVVAVYITPQCTCECESLENIERSSEQCSSHGDLICGMCRCNGAYQGRKCECNGESSTEDDESCRRSQDEDICSGNGHCACGVCKCSSPLISGKYCECRKDNCPVGDNGELCSGTGECECGVCACHKEWKGANCGCSKLTRNCKPTYGGALCNGRGKCECNACVCESGYTGDTCENDGDGEPISDADSSSVESSGESQSSVTADAATTTFTTISILLPVLFLYLSSV